MAAQRLGRPGGLLGHGHVAGSAGGHGDGAHALDLPGRGHGDFRHGIVIRANLPADRLGLLRVQPRNEDVVRARVGQMPADADDLPGGLARAVDHLARALAHRAMVIDLGVAQILEGLGLEHGQRLVRGERARLHPVQNFLRVHFYAHLAFRSSRMGEKSSFSASRISSRRATAAGSCASGT